MYIEKESILVSTFDLYFTNFILILGVDNLSEALGSDVKKVVI